MSSKITTNHNQARVSLSAWHNALSKNFYTADPLLDHSLAFCFEDTSKIREKLMLLGLKCARDIESLVAENDFRLNLPKLDTYDAVGNFTNQVSHHPNYEKVGDAIYGSSLMQGIATAGNMTESLLLFYMTSHLGEAGHNCPVACTAGIIRVLSKVPDFKGKSELIEKLTQPSFNNNFTGAQFVTEVQGGSDVGLNDCTATQDKDGNWSISGEKWFCSNANADVILMTARFDKNLTGTKGLGLFLLKRVKDNGKANHIHIRRLKEKLGTRAMASAEIDFQDAHAICMGEPEQGFKLLMQNVLHISRIYNSFATLGAAQRAYQITRSYAQTRVAFSQTIDNYPLIQEPLATIRAENTAMLASALATTRLQDKVDYMDSTDESLLLLLRMRANINKYYTATRSVQHIHNCIDVLAGNGAIESFSPLPRLYRDAIVYENWEGTHNTLRMQILRDMHKTHIERIFINDLLEKTAKLSNTDHQDWLTHIKDALNKQLNQSEFIKRQAQPQQTLLVRDFIDKLAQLDACVHLFLQAEHQLASRNDSSKMKLLNWLLIQNNILDEKKYSKQWMELMAEIICIKDC